MKDKTFQYGHTVGLAAFGMASFLLLVCAVNICICCHPSKKGLQMRDRFVYMKEGQYTRV